jgi:hypothetical protein
MVPNWEVREGGVVSDGDRYRYHAVPKTRKTFAWLGAIDIRDMSMKEFQIRYPRIRDWSAGVGGSETEGGGRGWIAKDERGVPKECQG